MFAPLKITSWKQSCLLKCLVYLLSYCLKVARHIYFFLIPPWKYGQFTCDAVHPKDSVRNTSMVAKSSMKP